MGCSMQLALYPAVLAPGSLVPELDGTDGAHVRGEGGGSEATGALETRDICGCWPVVSSAEPARRCTCRIRPGTVQMPDGALAPREVFEHPGAPAGRPPGGGIRGLGFRQN